MTPADVRPGTYIDYGVEHNDKAGGHISISKQKNVFQKNALQI